MLSTKTSASHFCSTPLSVELVNTLLKSFASVSVDEDFPLPLQKDMLLSWYMS